MRKIFVYSLEEEEQINKELGYTQKDYVNYDNDWREKVIDFMDVFQLSFLDNTGEKIWLGFILAEQEIQNIV